MAKSGPIPLPTAVKVAQGNRGKRDLSKKHEPEPELGAPDKPDSLGELASEIWDELVEITLKMGVLTKADGHMLEIICNTKEVWLQAKQALEDNGDLFTWTKDNEIRGRHPAQQIMDATGKDLAKFLAEFGLTPSARTRVHVSRKKDKKNEFGDL